MLWTKQYYAYDVERGWSSTAATRWTRSRASATRDWFHLVADDVLSMPDKWEYPWFAAWDLAFHTIPLALVDLGFAKQQIDVLLRRLLPASERPAAGVRVELHRRQPAGARLGHALRLPAGEGRAPARATCEWLEAAFQKLVKNFTWWVNRKDPDGRNVFEGGFLGLDNIGVFDRSAPLPTGGHLDQADGTAWMALYAQVMLAIALELSTRDPVYLEQAETFFEHFAWIAAAMNRPDSPRSGLWDEEDGFFYDVLRLPDGTAVPLKVRSMVGLLPLAAATVIPSDVDERFPGLVAGAPGVHRPAPRRAAPASPGPGCWATTAGGCSRCSVSTGCGGCWPGCSTRRSSSARTASGRCPATTPTTRTRFDVGGQDYRVSYLPAESDTGHVRRQLELARPDLVPGQRAADPGPAQPVRLLRRRVHRRVPDRLRAADDALPGGGGDRHRLTRIFLPRRRRPPARSTAGWRSSRPTRTGANLLMFHEYFHGDNGAGIGASHQTGWTGLVALSATLAAQHGRRGACGTTAWRRRSGPARGRRSLGDG